MWIANKYQMLSITIMKGQANLLIFILLFIISLFLFVAASSWSTNIFQQNVDVTNIQNAEKFMRGLDTGIINLVKYGGSQEFRYNVVGGTIEIGTNTVEIKIPVSIQLQKQWVNLTSDGSFIQERQEGNTLRIQAVYNQTDYKIEFIPGGSSLANPEYVTIERNSTYIDNGKTVIRIKITFA